MLKVIKKETLSRNLHLIEAINRSEQQIKARKFVKTDTFMTAEEVDDLLMQRDVN